ncbi:uncharacterized protein [Arachis hypogaea]|uniref:uncharacterized protein isoform X1 n=1 Tax=Arachis hypogaea TaxID=3818 RepID=UPI0007AF78BC
MWMLCLVHNLLSFKRELKKMMLFKIFSRPIGMDKFKGTYPVRRVCEDAAIVGIFEFFGSDLSPDKVITQKMHEMKLLKVKGSMLLGLEKAVLRMNKRKRLP